MKKLFYFFIIVSILFLACVYLFIPSEISISESKTFQSSVAGCYRKMAQIQNWQKWWPDKKSVASTEDFINKNILSFGEDTFAVTKQLYNNLVITICKPNAELQTTLFFLPVINDTISLDWRATIYTSKNPLKRLAQYNHAKDIREKMTVILDSIQSFYSKNENIYGIPISETSTTDTILISTNKIIKSYPNTSEIYGLIQQLKIYSQQKGALQTGHPFLNITALKSDSFRVMVALPINKTLSETQNIVNKRMVPGRFLVTTVIGGIKRIDDASAQVDQYFQDFHRIAIAIPFQVLLTDRMQQTDTSKWITKLYFPVM